MEDQENTSYDSVMLLAQTAHLRVTAYGSTATMRITTTHVACFAPQRSAVFLWQGGTLLSWSLGRMRELLLS